MSSNQSRVASNLRLVPNPGSPRTSPPTQPLNTMPTARHPHRWGSYLVSVLGHGLLIGGLAVTNSSIETETNPVPVRIIVSQPPPAASNPGPVTSQPLPAKTPVNVPKKPPLAPKIQPKPRAKPPSPVAKATWIDQPGPKPELTDHVPAKTVSSPAIANGAGIAVAPGAVTTDLYPPYPAIAIKRGWQGVVHIAMSIAADGTPQKIELLQSSGHTVLDNAVLTAADRMRFQASSTKLRTYQRRYQFRLTK